MYSVGQTVVYGIHGVCKITNIQQMRVDKRNVDFFVLEPIDQPGANYFVPCNNQNALAKLSPVLTKMQLDEMLENAKDADDVWVSDENRRKQRYKELIGSADRISLLRMIGSLYDHKKQQIEAGRKFHQTDENFLHDAEKLLSTEFSLVLGISIEDVANYIKDKLNAL